MVRYCPTCGNATDKNVKFCPKCGNEMPSPTIPESSKPIEKQPSNAPDQTMPSQKPPTPPPQQSQPYQPPMQQPPQGYPPQKKSHGKLFAGIIALVIILAAVFAVYFLFFGNEEGKFTGTWTIESMKVEYAGSNFNNSNDTITPDEDEDEFTFNSDGTWTIENYQDGTWEIKDEKLVLKNFSGLDEIKFDYKFDGNDLELTYTETQYTWTMYLTKK